MLFQITEKPIEIEKLKKELEDASAGSCVTFEGRVRDSNDGAQVIALEYEAYEEMCLAEGSKILIEAAKKFQTLEALCVHRIGRLDVGECAVWIGVASAHRREGFEAARYVIDEIKKRLPVWKKEYYQNGDSGWVNCSCHEHPSVKT